ncbi:MAG: hypothetical protein QHH09_02580 [Microgenomates group bacterium]|nr:hypothetical protein [Microgenomates group bacterium]
MKKRIIIVLVIISSFFISSYFANNVFIAGTPKLNRNYLAKFFSEQAVTEVAEKRVEAISADISESLDKTNLKQLSRGVYAGENKSLKVTKFVENEIEWEQMTIVTNSSKEVVLKYPSGQPPLKEMIDLIKSE